MKSICSRTELGQTELLGKLVSAGLKAVAANGETFRLPLRFVIADETGRPVTYALNEPKPVRK